MSLMKWILAGSLLVGSHAAAQDNDGKEFPWYGSLKKDEVNVRSGPGNQYPILWVYQRAGYPVQVVTRYDNYYKLRDVEGEEGWAYVGMISRRQTGLVGGDQIVPLRGRADPASAPVARLAPGVVVTLDSCENADGHAMCKVIAHGTKGWVDKKSLLMVD